MLKTMLKTLLLASTLTVAGLAHAADITLRATANSNENDEDYDGLVVFKNYVENASNGAIAVELFIGTQLCATGEECLQGVADGSIDIYISTSGGAAGLFPYIQVLDLPYLMSDDRVAETVLTGNFTRELRAKALADSDNKIRLMTIGNTGGWRNYANTQRTVKSPDDLKGLKMRTVPAPLPQQVATAVGAAPTPIPWPELFTSLQTGVVEGTANGITDIMSMKFPDAGLKYLTLDGHSYMGAFWWMSNDRFQSLTPAQKQIVVDGFAALQQATFASPKRKEIAAYQNFVKAGGEVYVPTAEEKAAFKAAVAPVFDWFKGNVKDGAEIFDKFQAAVADAEAKVAAERTADLN
ncbi:TRAP transporter substrate-binding protein [Pannonibacter tanglangensis]|uniref:C4-dicarboxylate ABC transporter substrate-binding protein n=1 Tax=Pannonibacter tanglangensis TaxID=2750084 RepID=A0ABW9ZLJ7_9HYPH|nr:TRAP transporter substrate-binding protein DctP [Pannonibacter sp. XCT-34]NBN63917.1 C4-dicarboxylate ABC transporter substrate-binding protein [Pannonibacter sp. XCT-34]